MRVLFKAAVSVLVVVTGSWTSADPAGFHPRQEDVLALAPAAEETTTTTVPPTTITIAPDSTTTTAATAPPTTQPPETTTTTATPPSTVAPEPGARAPVGPLPIVPPPVSPPPARDLAAYRGLGTWVDAYDFSPEYQPGGAPAPVGPGSVDDMARVGVRTLYLQAAKDDVRSPGLLVNPEIIGPMLVRAHTLGIRVVAWYLPKFYDLDSDMARLLAIRDFRFEGQGFDGIGLDIEWRKDVPDHRERNARLVELSRRLRAAMGGATLSAIPPPPVVMEDVNRNFWPEFPWRELAPLYDVWLPMAYWTFRTQSSGWRDGYRYTAENVNRMRSNLGLPAAPVHPIGGTDNRSTDEDYRGFVRAARETGSIGGSIYDFRTTPAQAWEILRQSPS
ncbi:MAG: hypothetical protein ACRDZ3_22500 [Acidimicrobiia bacterium]